MHKKSYSLLERVAYKSLAFTAALVVTLTLKFTLIDLLIAR
jgi:hypothetical protein